MSIKTAVLNGVATIEIASPEKRNALTVAMYQAMADALVSAVDDGAVRAVLITGQPGVHLRRQRVALGGAVEGQRQHAALAHFEDVVHACSHKASKMPAAPWPVPTHIVTMPYLRRRRRRP